jgi:hypothetical protein
VIGSNYKTIPIAVQYLQGGYGSRDMGAMMAMMVLAIIPIVIFYLTCQEYIIKGVVTGAVKGKFSRNQRELFQCSSVPIYRTILLSMAATILAKSSRVI